MAIRTSFVEDPSVKVEMYRDPISDDKLRWILQGRIAGGSSHGFKEGGVVQIKALKSEAIASGSCFSQKELNGHKVAAKICDRLNATVPVNKEAFVCPSMILKSRKDHVDSQKRIIARKGQLLLVVEAPQGNNIWFNSNSGAADASYRFPNFLSHWSWVCTKEKYMVCCLQGVRSAPNAVGKEGKSDYYRFVDPAIMSETIGKFGIRDLGKKGILEWFENHECNDLCQAMGIAGKVPQNNTRTNEEKITLV